ncbi:MAG: hypothetical protein DRH12_17270, partial [Deltaproteobacteria bacterium]
MLYATTALRPGLIPELAIMNAKQPTKVRKIPDTTWRRNAPMTRGRLYMTPNHLKSQKGSIAITAAIFIMAFITVLAFLVNAGYLYSEKSIYQNAAEAAAMAGAVRLCDGDAIGVAKQIAIENGAPQGSVSVTLGFY